MAGALHLLPVFLLCGYFTLVSTRSDGDVPAARAAFSTTGSLSSAGTEAPTSADHDRTAGKPGKSPTIPRHLSEQSFTRSVTKRTKTIQKKRVGGKTTLPKKKPPVQQTASQSVDTQMPPSRFSSAETLQDHQAQMGVGGCLIINPSLFYQTKTTVLECPPLGLESLRVKDTQLRASSYKRRGLGPHRGRLNIQSGVEDGDIYDGAWCAHHRDKQQWLEIDALRRLASLGSSCRVAAPFGGQHQYCCHRDVPSKVVLVFHPRCPPQVVDIKAQLHFPVTLFIISRMSRCAHLPEGPDDHCVACPGSWDVVHSYKVQLSNDSLVWKPCMNGTEEAIFEGNQDPETPVLSLFNSTVARYIRINPQTWYQNGTEGDICLRAEVLGCTLPDPNNLYPWQTEPPGSKDKLDFRHHNYKEMRKLMRSVNQACPDVTRIYSIGKSYKG
ncbi:Inactive carboxypeptidase-like protein X2 [Takifugu flavidus]|uniref:Inactive carboxypeptidase-like protein X2 n=1 Tax=Takifugu flavidus TaxID=433684 RepID=A0A5C6MI96_9TELE|nr:Inactive carboxypeptidase-like protein X2 [Takifugu flavidus]